MGVFGENICNKRKNLAPGAQAAPPGSADDPNLSLGLKNNTLCINLNGVLPLHPQIKNNISSSLLIQVDCSSSVSSGVEFDLYRKNPHPSWKTIRIQLT